MTAFKRNSPVTRISLLVAAVAAAIGLYTAIIANAGATTAMPATATQAVSTHKVVAFHRTMDKLWEDHVTWTRMAIVSFAAGLPDLGNAETRLLKNQVDIGNAIKPFYGRAAGDKLTSLLHTHILQAVAVLQAAKAGDQTQLAAAQKAWYKNADQIAAFLAKANPRFWPRAEMKKMMHRHLALTTEEAVARLQGDWAADVTAYDKVHNEILRMSNMLANGIIGQFPQRFAR
jgi:hypothetical protein